MVSIKWGAGQLWCRTSGVYPFQPPYYPGYKPTFSSPRYYIGVVGYVNTIFTFEKSKKGGLICAGKLDRIKTD